MLRLLPVKRPRSLIPKHGSLPETALDLSKPHGEYEGPSRLAYLSLSAAINATETHGSPSAGPPIVGLCGTLAGLYIALIIQGKSCICLIVLQQASRVLDHQPESFVHGVIHLR